MIVITFFILVSNANAMDVGLGIELKSDYSSYGATIYVPIDISPSFRLEPHFAYGNIDGEDVRPTSSSSDSTTLMELGVGAFGIQQVDPSTKLYFGARLSYLSFEDSRVYPTSWNSTDENGFEIAPTVGFEYFLRDNISLGGEAAWFYAKLEGEETSSSSPTTETEYEVTGTDTQVILRYYF